MRAEAIVIFNIAVTRRAMRQLLEILEKIFLLQRPLESHIERLLWSKNQIQQETWEVKEDNQQCGKHLCDYASASGFAIAVRPNDKDKPKRHEVRTR